jgi:hypothetical protein
MTRMHNRWAAWPRSDQTGASLGQPVCNPTPKAATIALDLQPITSQNERCVAWPLMQRDPPATQPNVAGQNSCVARPRVKGLATQRTHATKPDAKQRYPSAPPRTAISHIFLLDFCSRAPETIQTYQVRAYP